MTALAQCIIVKCLKIHMKIRDTQGTRLLKIPQILRDFKGFFNFAVSLIK